MNNIYHSNKRRPPPFFYSYTNPALSHVLVHSVDKTHVMVVTMELIWLLFLNILSFNYAPTPNISLRFTRFRKSYVNLPAVVLIKFTLFFCIQSYAANLRNLFLLNTPVARELLTSTWVSRQKDVISYPLDIHQPQKNIFFLRPWQNRHARCVLFVLKIFMRAFFFRNKMSIRAQI